MARRGCAGTTTAISDIARKRGAGFVVETPTWRANPDWAEQLGYSLAQLDEVNRAAVALAEEVRASAAADGITAVVSGCIGPRGDGYDPAHAMTSEKAERYHAAQIGTFADTSADQVTAMTITNAEEAIGIVRAATAAGIPAAMSFTVETDGRLPTGQPLHEAIEQVDAATGTGAAVFHGQLCTPDPFRVSAGARWGVAAAAPRSACELVGRRATPSSTRPPSSTKATRRSSAPSTPRCRTGCPKSGCSAAAAARTLAMWPRSSRHGGRTRLLPMSALDAIADWPVPDRRRGGGWAVGRAGAHGDTAHLFALASVTKPLVARAVQVAIEEGVVGLDTAAGPPGSTVRHLLAHASGLSMHSDELASEPGKRRVYSNYGFAVLAETVQRDVGHRVRPLPGRGGIRTARYDEPRELDGGSQAAGYGGYLDRGRSCAVRRLTC